MKCHSEGEKLMSRYYCYFKRFNFFVCMSECACECRHPQSLKESVILPGAGVRGGCEFLRQVLGTKLCSSVITFSCFVIFPVL